MKKEKLIKKIDEAISTEEKAIPIYAKHLDALTELSGLNEEQKEKLRKYFKKMKKQTKEHEEALTKLKEEIEREDRDEY